VNIRLIFLAPQCWIFGLALLLPAAPGEAAPIRVTAWDLQPNATAGTNDGSDILEAAKALKKLQPDVIILQQVADWQTCHRLAQALQPETYQVAICSAFRDPRTKLLSRQAAILCTARAHLSWSEPWQNNGESPGAPGGFAFAALRLANKNIGIFSVQLSDGASPGQQLVKQIAALQNWRDNRPQAFILAGDFNARPDLREKTWSDLQQIGFENAVAGLPLEKRATADLIFMRDAGLAGSPLITRTALLEHYATTCEIDLAAPKVAPIPVVGLASHPPAGNRQLLLWLAAFLAGGAALLVLARKLARRSELPPRSFALPGLTAKGGLIGSATSHASQIVVAPPPASPPYVQIEMEGSTQTQSQTWRSRPAARLPGTVRAGVIANLSRWLKQKVVQRLLSDRARLLATQETAVLKVLAVDERLTKIEHHIQQRNQEYEQRIDDLLKALLTAKEENRELIRAKIALVKAEMAKARLKAGSHAREHQQY
jgi:endonuclease/exonuclease/phosphatase family metal-dependent hydrolase